MFVSYSLALTAGLGSALVGMLTWALLELAGFIAGLSGVELDKRLALGIISFAICAAFPAQLLALNRATKPLREFSQDIRNELSRNRTIVMLVAGLLIRFLIHRRGRKDDS